MKAFNVSDNIAFDGNTYYCRRCGKAGYARPTQVRGHLALCPGTLLRKGAPTTSQMTSRDQSQPLTTAYNGGALAGQLPLAVVADSPVAPQSYQPGLMELVESNRRQIATLNNEYAHVLTQVNEPPQQQDGIGAWLSKNMSWVVVGAVLILALLGMDRGACTCPAGASATGKRAGPDYAKLSERVINKAADTAITKSFGRMFN